MSQGLKGIQSLTQCLSVPDSLWPLSEGILDGVREVGNWRGVWMVKNADMFHGFHSRKHELPVAVL